MRPSDLKFRYLLAMASEALQKSLNAWMENNTQEYLAQSGVYIPPQQPEVEPEKPKVEKPKVEKPKVEKPKGDKPKAVGAERPQRLSARRALKLKKLEVERPVPTDSDSATLPTVPMVPTDNGANGPVQERPGIVAPTTRPEVEEFLPSPSSSSSSSEAGADPEDTPCECDTDEAKKESEIVPPPPAAIVPCVTFTIWRHW